MDFNFAVVTNMVNVLSQKIWQMLTKWENIQMLQCFFHAGSSMKNFTHAKSLGPTLVTDASDMLLIGSVS